jgi:hypothetical protein
MRTYSDKCGADAILNKIVFAGAHDAGIWMGGGNARTQSQNIGGQARSGIRLFDLRIAASSKAGHREGGQKVAELRAYHADDLARKDETKTRYIGEVGRAVQVERSKIRAGTFGQTLTTMLAQAEDFVNKNKTEFLILKFDKCLNYKVVAEACVTLLGTSIYKRGGNLNTKTLGDLAGKVICVFSKEGLDEIAGSFGPLDGILGIRNTSGSVGYTDAYDGLQYFGKGGTSLMGTSPIEENRRKQVDLFKRGIQGNPEALGMMYWTSTGLVGNIKTRDKKMWSATNVKSLQDTWENGLQQAIHDRIGKRNAAAGGGGTMKAFMPNIVMIDFADGYKCKTIMDLNDVAGHQLAALEFLYGA